MCKFIKYLLRGNQRTTEVNFQESVLNAIRGSDIDDLIKGINPDHAHHYPWNILETEEVLKKCETTLHCVILYQSAFQEFQKPYRNTGKVTQDIIDKIHFATVQKISDTLKTTRSHELEYLGEIHNRLKCSWNNRNNSPERELLQKRVEVVWMRLSRESFEKLKNSNTLELKLFERLFNECKKDDPITLEVAEFINDNF